MESNPPRVTRSVPLRAYAVVLSLLHPLTATAWFTYKHIASLATGEDCVCWPFFPGCEALRSHLAAGGVGAATVTYGALGLGAAVAFLIRGARSARTGTILFVAATLLGTCLYALDYRLRLNQTYMLAWVILVFLLARRPLRALQAVIALFYFWAGTLKVNAEWTSGAALYHSPLLVPAALVPAACVYVLVLELVLVWGLFAPWARVRWVVYAQLILFHAVSWPIVGYFYPLLMFGLTSTFPLVWISAPEETLTWRGFRADASTRREVLVLAGVFSLFQLVPCLYPGDTALTGEGRVFALHMFDARVACEGGALLTAANGRQSRAELINPQLDVRTRCDPIVLIAEAERLCSLLAAQSDPARIARVDVLVDAKRSSDPVMQPLVRARDVCNHPVRYSPYRHNDWIGAGAGEAPPARTERTPATTNSARNGE
jgi:hypothetical protein